MELFHLVSSRLQEIKFVGLGGMTLSDATKYIINASISHDMQLQMNWIGRAGWRARDNQVCKTGLKETHICKVMIGR